jgi:uncharacterized protein (TIGR02145 family)
MAENLKYLPGVSSPVTGSLTTPYFYVNGYDSTNVNDAKATANYTTYGVLYNWTAACNSCPAGWHLPGDAEWTQLTNFLGGEINAGGPLKETGTTHWTSPNTGATNGTGFTALPGGYRKASGNFDALGGFGLWWSATTYSADSAWCRSIAYYHKSVIRENVGTELGLSVRCVRD